MASPVSPADLVATFHKLAQHADTAYVLFTATALEDMLETAMLAKMRDLSNTVHSELFKGYGPLASFSAKIETSYALKLIGDDLIGDFRAIKAIRNAFAHPREVTHFNSPHLTKHAQKLTGYKKTCDPRKLFDDRIAACIGLLDRHIETSIFVRALEKHAERSS
jgi:hypothetical protein